MPKLLKTPQYEQDIVDIFRYSLSRFGRAVALETKRQTDRSEEQLARGADLGKHDLQYHSSRFQYATTRNRQILFFEVAGDCIVMVMAGYDGRNWKDICREMEPFLETQIVAAKERMEKNRRRQKKKKHGR